MSARKFEYIPGVENCAGEMNVAFPVEEYKNRLTKIREIMDREKIDFLYVTAPESMYYVSGYNVVWHRVNSPEEWYDALGSERLFMLTTISSYTMICRMKKGCSN